MEHAPNPDRLTLHEAQFAALMRMEEGALIQHVRTAPKEDLPAAVLARAYRELWLEEGLSQRKRWPPGCSLAEWKT
jgi:hypothetical protein